MISKNKNASKCFDDLISSFSKLDGMEKDITQEFQNGKIRIAKDDKGARVNARIDAMISGKDFDESSTPVEELETVDEDIINEFINREIENLLGD